MNLSFNLLRLLHRAYPCVVLAAAFISWADRVQGEEKHILFQPPDSLSHVGRNANVATCSPSSEFFTLRRADSCPEGEASDLVSVQLE